MSFIGEQDILSKTKASLLVLESLNAEQVKIIDDLEKNVGLNDIDPFEKQHSEEKIKLLTKLVGQLREAVDGGNDFISINNYLEKLEADKQKLRYQGKRLMQENVWLRDKLAESQESNLKSELRIVQLEEQMKSLQFVSEMRKYDSMEPVDSSGLGDGDRSNDKTELDLGFPLDDQNENDQYAMTQSQTVSMSQGSSNYEIPTRLRTLHNLVVQYAMKGRYEVAIPLCKQALEDLEKTSGQEHPDVATMLNILALVYRDQGKYREAATLLNDALSIREKALGPNHPSIAATLNNLAVLYGKRARYKEAEPLCHRALVIRESVLGKDHPDVAKQLNNLALLCQNQGKYKEVEHYYQRALGIYNNSLGSDDPCAIKTKTNLGAAYMKQEKYAEAEALYKEIIFRAYEKYDEKKDGVVKSIWQWAEEYQDNGGKSSTFMNQLHEAMQSLLAISKRAEAHYLTALITSFRNLIVLYRRQNKFQATEVIEECFKRLTQMNSMTESTYGGSTGTLAKGKL